jgi:hypothetical protein
VLVTAIVAAVVEAQQKIPYWVFGFVMQCDAISNPNDSAL